MTSIDRVHSSRNASCIETNARMSVSSAIRARVRQSKPPALLEGKVFMPEHGAFDRARRAWNLPVDQRPVAVVVAESVEDVIATVELA